MTSNLFDILLAATQRFLKTDDQLGHSLTQHSSNLRDLERFISHKNLRLDLVLAEAALIVLQHSSSSSAKSRRSAITFQVSSRPTSELVYTGSSSVRRYLEPKTVRKCLISANQAIELIYNLGRLYEFGLFETLGLRNTSALVGELFVEKFCLDQKEFFVHNPNQDGYPDLCAMTPEGIDYIKMHSGDDGRLHRDKQLWSPFPFEGIEVKATCGNTPPASRMPKPAIGEERLPIVTSAEWKAHHQKTKVLLGLYWDFVSGIPTILAAFFRNDLDTRDGADNPDWGGVVQPREGGGRTTSVSIMKQGRSTNQGVKKMGHGWIVLPQENELLRPIRRIFHIQVEG